jgi:hypothetical protein
MGVKGKNLLIAINSFTNLFSNSKSHDFLLNIEERYRLGFGEIELEVADMSTINRPLDCLDSLISLLLKKFSIFNDNFDIGRSIAVK